MKKRGPAKKNAPTPAKKTKRKYTKRSTKSVVGGGGEIQSDNGLALLRVEKFETVSIKTGFRWTDEYRMMEQLIKKLNPKEGFNIKAEWKSWPHKIVKELQLRIVLVTQAVAGNDQVRRVVRVK